RVNAWSDGGSGLRGVSRLIRGMPVSLPQPAAPPPASAGVASGPSAAGPAPAALFAHVPTFAGGRAVLFDSARPEDAQVLPGRATLRRLVVRFLDGTPRPEDLGRGLALLIFVDDPMTPRARVRLADLVRQGCERPLNLVRQPGQAIRIELVDPDGAWASGTPRIEVALDW